MNGVGDVGIRETLAPTLLPYALFSTLPYRLPVSPAATNCAKTVLPVLKFSRSGRCDCV